MRGLRHFLGDRLSGGVVCALLVYLFVVQALIAGIARGAVAADVSAGGILCTASVAGSGDVPDGHTAGLDLPCASLCQLAAAAGPGTLVAEAMTLAPDLRGGGEFPPVPTAPPAAHSSIVFAARAPPAVSD